MKLAIYQIDAFAAKSFEGNPAAVVPLDFWLSDDVMQSIAEENNLAETAFFVPTEKGYSIRWFTPVAEVKLCGHATLASAFVIFNELNYNEAVIEFESLSGKLFVAKQNDLLVLDFPSQEPEKCEIPENIIKGLKIKESGYQVIGCFKSEDYILVFEDEKTISEIVPNHDYLQKLDLRGVAITAISKKYDFVARLFAPKLGILEDSVTGSLYTELMPYWTERLGKCRLSAKQLSARGGELICEQRGERVLISGKAVKYLEGFIEIEVKN